MHVVEQLAAYALDCLDDEDAAGVAEHLAGCARCRRELESYLEVTGQLALVAREVSPEEWVKRRVMQRVAPLRRARKPAPPRAWWSQFVGLFQRSLPAWGMAALAVIVVLAAGNVWLWRQAYPRTPGTAEMRVLALVPSEAAPGAGGRLVISSDGEYGSLVVENLPVPEAAHQYQVWLTQSKERISGGTFSVNDHGYGVTEIMAPQPLMSYTLFSVTEEPAGGSPAPTSAAVLEGSP